MKRSLLIIVILLACYATLERLQFFNTLLAQSIPKPTSSTANPAPSTRSLLINQPSPAQRPTQDDLALAATIRRLANRSTEGLVEENLPDGGVTLDLRGRFQNLPLVKLDTDGEVSVGCVDNLEDANYFFGKNLATGEVYPKQPKLRAEGAGQAARFGLSQREYQFYQRLIEEAQQRRLLSPALAAITIVNNDGLGEGFNDPTPKSPEGGNTGTTLGQQRLILFNQAAAIWGAFLDSSVPTSVRANFDPLTPCSSGGGVLGQAGTVNISRDFANAPFAGTWYHAALANKLNGSDQVSANPEIVATFNSNVDTGCLGGGSRFYYGLDNATPSGTINLLVVLLHEIGHGLGFSSFVNGNTGQFINGFPDIYSRFMFDRSAGLFWYQMTDAQRQASALNTGNVLWDGPSVRLASGYLTGGNEPATGQVQLYMPNPLQGGSSISHWAKTATPNLLMEPSINIGLSIDLDLTRQQMRDIGWYRDSTADLVADSIANVQPSGGTLSIGSNASITWANTGSFNRNVTIELSTDGGTTFPITIASDVSNTGTHSFTVPNSPTTLARIRVREHNFAAPVGVSSVNFVISSTVALTISSVTPPAGRTLGGQPIRLAGSLGNLSTVTIGGNPVSWFYSNGTSEITITTPAHTAGAVNIDLTPLSGSPYTKSNAFAYLPTTFTDNTLVVGATTTKTQHTLELRQAVDALRAVAGLSSAPWTDSNLAPTNSLIKAVHITELRTYLENATALLGYSAGTYTDPTLSNSFMIKRAHIEELRQRIRSIAG